MTGPPGRLVNVGRNLARRLRAGALTAGQAWTAGLVGVLAVALLAFGFPTKVRSVAAAPPPEVGSAGGSASSSASPAAPAPPDASFAAAGPVSVPAGSGLPPGQPAPPAPVPAVHPLPQLVALVAPSSTPGDPTSDRSMAERYLARAGLAAVFVGVGAPEATCRAVATTAHLAIAAGSLDPSLAACLARRGVSTVAFDDRGSGSARRPGLVSTRRGVPLSLLDIATRLARTLPGKVALVADQRFRDEVLAVLPRLARQGMRFSSTVWLAPGAGSPDPAQVLELAAAGVGTLVFATSVANQSAWATPFAAVRPGARFVVADAADSVVASGYPILFDGAQTVTAVQFPWFAPPGSSLRADCARTWTSGTASGTAPGTADLLRALSWCQDVSLAAAALTSGGDPYRALVRLRQPSPITSPLGPLGGAGSFGPTELAVATWRQSCSCWQRSSPFSGGGSG